MTLLYLLAVFAVEEVAHGFAAGGVGFARGLEGVGAGSGGISFVFAAGGAAVGEAGFARFQLELFRADDAGFDGEGHFGFYDTTGVCGIPCASAATAG